MSSSWGEELKEEGAEEIKLAAKSFEERRGRLKRRPAVEISDRYLRHVSKGVSQAAPIKEEKLCTIYRVPPEIVESDGNVGKFYKPKVVSIGPYVDGRKDELLRPMQDHKWTCLNKLISKYQQDDQTTLLRRCLKRMMELEEEIRNRYSEPIDPDSKYLALRMVLDGCFILYLLLKAGDQIEADKDDVQHVVGRVWIWTLVKYDLLLLGNQIPFFVIKHLHDILVTPPIDLVDCALRYFSSLDPCRKQGRQSSFYIPVDSVHHLLHLVYKSLLPCPQYCKPPPKTGSTQWIPSATELKDAGVKFKKREIENKRCFLSFLDIKFNDGVMEIPQLRVHDYSVGLFRNLIAFEQCYPDTDCHVTAYAKFMNCLIDKEEDMRSLHLDDILVSGITTEKEAERFFRRLCNEVHCAPEKNYLGKLITDVTDYRGTVLHQLVGFVKREYFKNQLTTLLVIVGMLAFLFSLTQGIISMYFNFHPRK